MSSIWPEPISAFCRWGPSAKTIAFPTGRPHDRYVGARSTAGREAPLPTPRTARPPTTTLSPRGPQANGPGSVSSNMQVRPVPSGATAQARPRATNAMVFAPDGRPSAHPSGSEATSGAPDAIDAGGAGRVVSGLEATGVLIGCVVAA